VWFLNCVITVNLEINLLVHPSHPAQTLLSGRLLRLRETLHCDELPGGGKAEAGRYDNHTNSCMCITWQFYMTPHDNHMTMIVLHVSSHLTITCMSGHIYTTWQLHFYPQIHCNEFIPLFEGQYPQYQWSVIQVCRPLACDCDATLNVAVIVFCRTRFSQLLRSYSHLLVLLSLLPELVTRCRLALPHALQS